MNSFDLYVIIPIFCALVGYAVEQKMGGEGTECQVKNVHGERWLLEGYLYQLK